MAGRLTSDPAYTPLFILRVSTMDKSQPTLAPVEFYKDAEKFLEKCTKPDKAEYLKIVRAVGAGFLMMGAIGYVVKLVHIPIRHLITV